MLTAFLNLLLPPICPACAEHTENRGFCRKCHDGIRFIASPLCACCGVPFVSQQSSGHFCARCIKEKMPFLKARSIGAYEGVLLEAIHMFKYSGKTSLAKPLGKLMADGFSNKGCDLVVPVPLHKTRLKERGFNQSLFLARELAAIHNLPVDYIHLKRIRATDPQINLKEKERVKNVRGAFAAANGKVFIDKHILLIDDVYTTGATIRECGRILKRAGAKGIDVLTLARVVNL